MTISKDWVLGVIVVIFVMMFFGWLARHYSQRKRVKDRKEIVSKEPLHDHYMTLEDRLSLAKQIQDEAFPQPDDSAVTIRLGKNDGFKVHHRIGSRSKYASSYQAETNSGNRFAMRVYAVPAHDRSQIEREGLQHATSILKQGCSSSMPVVYRCYRTTKCTLATPFDGPNSGVCHIIVNELANMDVEQWIQGGPSLPQVKAVCFQVIHALYCLLHCAGKRHGDMKASNVLVFFEPVQHQQPQFLVYKGDNDKMDTMYVPWTGVRATLWDFEFLKPVNVKENVAGETLDMEKFIRELIFFHNRTHPKRDDEVGKHLGWMKNTIHQNYKKPLSYFLTTLFSDYRQRPSGDFTVLESFTCPTNLSNVSK